MQKKVIIVAIISFIVIIGAFVLIYNNSQSKYSNQKQTYELAGAASLGAGAGTFKTSGSSGTTSNTIEITVSGFSPKSLTINKGDTVTWINKGSSPSWPASAFHPTHTAYPESSIEKCGTSEESTIFDACRDLSEEES